MISKICYSVQFPNQLLPKVLFEGALHLLLLEGALHLLLLGGALLIIVSQKKLDKTKCDTNYTTMYIIRKF